MFDLTDEAEADIEALKEKIIEWLLYGLNSEISDEKSFDGFWEARSSIRLHQSVSEGLHAHLGDLDSMHNIAFDRALVFLYETKFKTNRPNIKLLSLAFDIAYKRKLFQILPFALSSAKQEIETSEDSTAPHSEFLGKIFKFSLFASRSTSIHGYEALEIFAADRDRLTEVDVRDAALSIWEGQYKKIESSFNAEKHELFSHASESSIFLIYLSEFFDRTWCQLLENKANYDKQLRLEYAKADLVIDYFNRHGVTDNNILEAVMLNKRIKRKLPTVIRARLGFRMKEIKAKEPLEIQRRSDLNDELAFLDDLTEALVN